MLRNNAHGQAVEVGIRAVFAKPLEVPCSASCADR